MKCLQSGKYTVVISITAFLVMTSCPRQEISPKDPSSSKPAEEKEDQEKSMKEKVQKQADSFLADYFEKAALLETKQASYYWKAANSGKKEDFAAYEKAELALKKLQSDSASFATIKSLLEKKEFLEPLTIRSLEVAYLDFKGNQLPEEMLAELVKESTEIGRIFSTFRGKLDGKEVSDNELQKILREENNSGRRSKIWSSLKQIGDAVGPQLVNLAKLRNKAAQKLGYKNFWEMRILLQEYDPEQIMDLFKELDDLTRKPFEKMKARMDKDLARRFRVPVSKLMPWHYDNPFFQAPPPSPDVDLDVFFKDKTEKEIVELSRKFFADISLPVEDILKRSDLYEREGKDQHAFCIAIDRLGDVRILVNIKPTAKWMGTQLHELGHAVYYKYIDFSLPHNLKDVAHILTTEGVAMLFGALAGNPEWLIKYAGADPKKVKKLGSHILEQRRREQLIFTRWTLVMLHFEKALYENPERDLKELNALWWDMVEKYQNLNRPQNRNAADWASKPHFTIAPVYYHNYMLGELFASQLRAGYLKHAKDSGSTAESIFTTDFGEFLIEKVFKPGRKMHWPAFVETSTGFTLSAKFFASELE